MGQVGLFNTLTALIPEHERMISTAEIMDKVRLLLSAGMQNISLCYRLTVAGAVLLALFLSLYLVRKNVGRSYTFKDDTPLRYHYIHMIMIPAAAVLVFLRVRGTSAVLTAFAALPVVIAIAADVFLFTWKWQGVALADISLIASTAAQHIWIRRLVSSTYSEIYNYSPAGIYSLLGVSDLWMFYAELMAVFTAAVIIINAGYYARRYYLFFPGELKGVTRCSSCGRPVFKNEKFCPNCGTQITQSVPDLPENLYRLIKGNEKYCPECGSFLRDGVCRKCGRDLREEIVDKAKDSGKDLASKVGLFAIFIILAIIPTFFSGALDLSKGSAVIHNAYVEKLQEYHDDRSVALDGDWLADYSEKYSALITKDSEWLTVPYRSLSRSNIPFYVSYAEAAYSQAEAMENINAEIMLSAEGKGIDEEALSSHLSLFNISVEDMRDASYAYSRLTTGEGTLKTFFHIVVDGIRYWVSKLPAILLPILMLVTAFISFILLIRDLSEGRRFVSDGCAALIPWLTGLIRGDTSGASVQSRSYIRSKRIFGALVLGLSVLCFIIAAVFPNLIKNDEDAALAAYMDQCRDIILTSMQEQQSCANELLRYSKEISPEEYKSMREILRNEISRDEAYLAVSEIPEGYEKFDRRMDELCQRDMELINEVLTILEDNKRPEQSLLVELSGLRLREFGDLTQEYMSYTIESVGSALMDD